MLGIEIGKFLSLVHLRYFHLLALCHPVLGQRVLLQQRDEGHHHRAHVEDGGGADGDGEHSAMSG